MQDKNFIKSIFRNGPSDLQIRKPAALLSGNGVNRIIHKTRLDLCNYFLQVNSRNSHWKEDTDNGSYPLAVPLLLLTVSL